MTAGPVLYLKILLLGTWYSALSAFDYAVDGLPEDKQNLPFWKKWLGLADSSPASAAITDAIVQLINAPKKRRGHHYKDVMVEWDRVWPQRAVKIYSLVILCLVLYAVVTTGAVVVGFLT